MLDALQGALAKARRTADLALLTLNDTRLGYALAQAAQRGVRVRIFSEREHRNELLSTLLSGARGQRSGRPRISRRQAEDAVEPLGGHCERLSRVQICYDDRPGLMHDKFAVIDDQQVFTGSMNWSYSGIHRNDNDSLSLNGESAARVFHSAFEALWQRKPRSPAPAMLEIEDGGELEIYFTPSYGHEAERRISSELNKAESEILVAAFVLTNPAIIASLNRAARRGVEVRVLLEQRNLRDSQEEELDRRVEVRTDANRYAMHLKTMVIDEKVVLTGSFNFTRSAVARNDENLLVLTSPRHAGRYKEKVWGLWQAASPR